MAFFYTIFFLVGTIVGIVLFWTVLERFSVFVCNKDGGNYSSRKKKNNLNKVLNYVNSKNEKITNDDIEELLDVSDSTSTRYLKELKRRGKIKQVGDEGRFVYYEKK